MATRSFIGKLLPNGSITGVYCHYDGYPEGVGATLRECYRDAVKVDALLALGDISSLGPEIGEKHDFNARDGFVTAYHRDRGEELNPPKVYRSFSDLRENAFHDLGAEFAYVYAEGGWEVVKTA